MISIVTTFFLPVMTIEEMFKLTREMRDLAILTESISNLMSFMHLIMMLLPKPIP
jgi:hypothetical protein